MFFLSHKWQRCNFLKYFENRTVIFWKKLKIHLLGTDTYQDRPDPDGHALDADYGQGSDQASDADLT
jgi:hypothetical protein